MFRLNLKQNIVFCEAAVLIVLNIQQITVAKKEGIEFFPTAACVFTIEVIEGHTVAAKILSFVFHYNARNHRTIAF